MFQSFFPLLLKEVSFDIDVMFVDERGKQLHHKKWAHTEGAAAHAQDVRV